MLDIHYTSNGAEMLIAEMSDEHLTNTVYMYLRNMHQGESVEMSPYHQALYNIKSKPEDRGKQDREIVKRLYPYLAEMFLRDHDGRFERVRAALGRALNRHGALPSPYYLEEENHEN